MKSAKGTSLWVITIMYFTICDHVLMSWLSLLSESVRHNIINSLRGPLSWIYVRHLTRRGIWSCFLNSPAMDYLEVLFIIKSFLKGISLTACDGNRPQAGCFSKHYNFYLSSIDNRYFSYITPWTSLLSRYYAHPKTHHQNYFERTKE